MPQLCTSRREADARYNPDADAVLETEVSSYGDLEIGRDGFLLPIVRRTRQKFAAGLPGVDAVRTRKTRDLGGAFRERRATATSADLNLRIGQPNKPLFKTKSCFILFRKAVRRMEAGEVENPDDLRLPPLDPAEVQKVLASYPTSYRYLGLT